MCSGNNFCVCPSFLLAFLKATRIFQAFPPMMEEFLEIVFLDSHLFPPHSEMRSVGYFDGVGQSFKTLRLWLCSLWFQVYIWNKSKLQCYWRLLTHLVPRGLALQIISSSVDCFFNKNYFENHHSSSTAWFCGHLLELHSRYPEKVCL